MGFAHFCFPLPTLRGNKSPRNAPRKHAPLKRREKSKKHIKINSAV
jgi:hypothetical protein